MAVILKRNDIDIDQHSDMWSNWSERHDRRGFLGNSAANGLFWYFKMFQFAIPLTFPLIGSDKKLALCTTAVFLNT